MSQYVFPHSSYRYVFTVIHSLFLFSFFSTCLLILSLVHILTNSWPQGQISAPGSWEGKFQSTRNIKRIFIFKQIQILTAEPETLHLISWLEGEHCNATYVPYNRTFKTMNALLRRSDHWRGGRKKRKRRTEENNSNWWEGEEETEKKPRWLT
jgi:hypothetical protein